MFSKNAQVMTLKDWQLISSIKKGDLIWDGDDLRRVTGTLCYRNFPTPGYLENYGVPTILCSPEQRFLMADNTWVKASSIEKYMVAEFLQDGEEVCPSLDFRKVEHKPLEKFYSLILEKPHNKLVVKLNYNTCLYAEARPDSTIEG